MVRAEGIGLALLLAVGGCGPSPPPPTVDAAAEREDEEAIRAAGAKERHTTGTGKKGTVVKWTPRKNGDDD